MFNGKVIYEGKAKCIIESDVKDTVIVHYKDSATAFNGVKKEIIDSKGSLNNEITILIFNYLSENGIKTHFIKKIDNVTQLCRKLDIIPLEFICRNIVAGSIKTRLGLNEGDVFDKELLEICYKNDDLNDPLINDFHVEALKLVEIENLNECYDLTRKINKLLVNLFNEIGIKLVDFKLEFGFDSENNILLADEFSPDNCRLWDKETNKVLDKDLFRKDLGDITVTYNEVLKRLRGYLGDEYGE